MLNRGNISRAHFGPPRRETDTNPVCQHTFPTPGRRTLGAAFLAACGLLVAPRTAQTEPQTIVAQGVLRGLAGQAVDGTYTLVFSLHDSAEGGAELWTEPGQAVKVTEGIFFAAIGASVPVSAGLLAQHDELWLGVGVDGGDELPRQPLQSVPYARFAGSAGGLACTGCVSFDSLDAAYAAGDGPGGAAVDLNCAGCVEASDLAPSALSTVLSLGGGKLTGTLDLAFLPVLGLRLYNGVEPPVACKIDVMGAVYFNTKTKAFLGCDGTNWRSLSAAYPAVDQAQPISSQELGWTFATAPNAEAGQVFVAGTSGAIASAALVLKRTGSRPGTLVHLELRAASGGIPVGGSLASSDSVPFDTLPAAPAIVTYSFAGGQGYALQAGTAYALILRLSEEKFDATNYISFYGTNYDSYPNGAWFRKEGAAWHVWTGLDAAFIVSSVK